MVVANFVFLANTAINPCPAEPFANNVAPDKLASEEAN